MKTTNKPHGGETLYKAFIYVALITFVITILVPVSWAFLASVKDDSEFYGNPWRCRRACISRTSPTPSIRPTWAPTSSTPSL